MRFEAIVELLGYASGHERTVKITTTERQYLVGIPTSVDTHPAANEVFLHPEGDDAVEIAISLGQIEHVELAS